MTTDNNIRLADDRGSASVGMVIDVSELQFHWGNNGVPLLDIESLQVMQGERVFIEGPSGSGKRKLPYQQGEFGVFKTGAYADMLLIDGNPLKDIKVMTDPGKENFRIIMKDGKIYKHTL